MLPRLHTRPPRRGAGVVTAVVIAVSIAASCLNPLVPAPPAFAQTAGGPTTTTTTGPPAVTTSTALPVTPSPTTTTANTTARDTGATNATTAPPTSIPAGPPPAWVTIVAGPPPPVPVTATAAELAQAALLQQQIVAESRALDLRAEQYDQAQQTAQAKAANLSRVEADLATAEARVHAAAATAAQSRQVVQDAAVEAYVGAVSHAHPSGTNALIDAYERGRNQAIGRTALGRATDAVQQLHRTEARLEQERDAIVDERHQAAAERDAARSAAGQAKLSAEAAAAAQVQLLTTLSKLQGNVATLVAAAQAAESLAAYARFTTGGPTTGIDFQTPTPVPGPPAQITVALRAALAQVGKPYLWGAVGPDSFDCSGLMQWSWARAGVSIPRVAAAQQAWAIPVPISQLQPGDLVFFGSPAHHVGMYVGNGTMVDAPHAGANVGVVPIWSSDLAGFGRVHQG